MRVVYVSLDPGVPVFGRKGSSVHVQAVLRILHRAGARVHLVTTRPGTDVPADLAGVTVHPIPVRASTTPQDREHALRAADRDARDVLDALGTERIDLVYERYSLWGASAMAWARAADVPGILEVNSPLVREQAEHRTLVDRDGAERVATTAITAARSVVAVSAPVAAWARRRTGTPERVHVLANGVDTARIVPASSRPTETVTFGFVGTLKPWHGLDVLLTAFATVAADLPGARLLVVGDGPEAAALDRLSRDLGIADRVERTGAVAPEDVLGLLHRMDVAVAPYPLLDDFYFSPLKVYEYLAAGLPTVASAIGDLPELLDDGRIGVLVPPGDPAALAGALLDLGRDPARRSALSAAARRRAVDEHDWTAVVDRALASVDLALPSRAGR